MKENSEIQTKNLDFCPQVVHLGPYFIFNASEGQSVGAVPRSATGGAVHGLNKKAERRRAPHRCHT